MASIRLKSAPKTAMVRALSAHAWGATAGGGRRTVRVDDADLRREGQEVSHRLKEKAEQTHVQSKVQQEPVRLHVDLAARKRRLDPIERNIGRLDPNCSPSSADTPDSPQPERNSRKKDAIMLTRMIRTRIMEQPQTLPQHRPLPPFISAPACSSLLHILNPSFFGICPSAAIYLAH